MAREPFIPLRETLARRISDRETETPFEDRPMHDRVRCMEAAQVSIDVIGERVLHIGALVAATDRAGINTRDRRQSPRVAQISAAIDGVWFYVTHGEAAIEQEASGEQ